MNTNIKHQIFEKGYSLISKAYMGGYSLMEIIIYMALLGIFLVSMGTLFTSSIDVKLESEAASGVQQDGRYLLNKLRHDISEASSITTPASLGAQGNTLTIVRSGVSYTYTLSGGNLTIASGGNTDVLSSPRSVISNLNFRRLGNAGGKNTISVSYTLTSSATRNSGPETRNYDLTFAIR